MTQAVPVSAFSPSPPPWVRWWRRAQGRPARNVDLSIVGEQFGGDYGGYVVSPGGLGADSVVYSFGIGEDLSFDLALQQRFGMVIHAFDPTPRSIAWVKPQQLPRLVLHEHGLLDYDGIIRFNAPRNAAHISHSVLSEGEAPNVAAAGAVELPVKQLKTVMRELGHARIDVLKMDIEGAEYAVIDNLVAERFDIGQLLLEFHHRRGALPVARTERAIDQLVSIGFIPFHVSRSGREWSFLRR